jgi:hypothetical protein
VPLPTLPGTTGESQRASRHLDYAGEFDGREILGTLRRAFGAMAARAVDLQRPSWWRYPEQYSRGASVGPGRVSVG